MPEFDGRERFTPIANRRAPWVAQPVAFVEAESSRIGESQARLAVTGTVMGAEGPVEGARVLLTIERAGEVRVTTTMSALDGRFAIPDVHVGRHEIVVIADGYAAARRDFVVSAGSTTSLNVNLVKAGTISGTVVDENGVPVVGVEVVVQAPPRVRLRGRKYTLVEQSLGGNVITDRNGRFSVFGLEPSVTYMLILKHATLGERTAGSHTLSPGEERSNLVIVW